MKRYLWSALGTLLLLCLMVSGCSDDGDPPPGDGGPPTDAVGDGANTEGGNGGDQGQGPDILRNPNCPLPGPCVLTKSGEGQHSEDALVIGEILTLTGEDLQDVAAVYVGTATAPLISATAQKVTCRIGPKTPPGQHTLEIKTTADTRRMFGTVTIRRLVAISAPDHTKLLLYQTLHSAYPDIDLAEAPAVRPTIDPTGRFVVALGATELMVADLALEQATTVGGLSGETVVSWSGDSQGQTLLLATQSGTLMSVDLTGFPALTATAVGAAPATGAVASVAEGLFAGLHPTAGASEGSLWYAPGDLSSFSWVQQGGSPFALGSASGLTALSISAADDVLALVAADGGNPLLGLANVSPGAPTLETPASLAAPGALGAQVASGGSYVVLSADHSSPVLPFVEVSAAATVINVILGGSGASRSMGFRLPTLADTAAALVGPTPSSGAFVADTLELADLAQGARITASGGTAALTLPDMRDAVGNPTTERIHMVTGTHFRTYILAVSNTSVTVTEHLPDQLLTAGKDYSWITVQP
jgi:hypothetical protein